MGGDQAAVAKLDTFFTQLNATRFAPYDWAGNEPGKWIPFEYDYAGAPWETQSVVRRIMTQLYPLAPAGEPGEDDLGAISSWYVWAALGLYPETPGVADLVLTSPLFPRVTITEGNGRTLTVTGTHAPDDLHPTRPARDRIGRIVDLGQAVDPRGGPVGRSALSRSTSAGHPMTPGGRPQWASPPSFSQGAAPAVPFTTPGGSLALPANGSATFQLGVQEEGGAASSGSVQAVAWHVAPSTTAAGVTLTPDSGTLRVVDGRSTTPILVASGSAGRSSIMIDLDQEGHPLPNLTLEVDVGT